MATHDPFDTASLEETTHDRVERARARLEGEVDDLKWLMGGKRGRRVVRRILADGGALDTFPSSFNTNAATMAFNEGRRMTANQLREKIMAYALDSYFLMLKERDEDE